MIAIILAAGEGKRMKSDMPKVLHKICGDEMINYVIRSCNLDLIKKIILVVGYKKELIKEKIDGVDFVEQDKQLGTGHAVLCAKNFIKDDEDVLILNGDMPLIDLNDINKIIFEHKKQKAIATIVSVKLKNPNEYGRIIRGEKNNFVCIREDKDANQKELLIKEINTGIYLFNGAVLKSALELLKNKNSQKEYYLTDTLEIIKNKYKNINVFCCDDDDAEKFLGVNDRLQLARACKIMQKKINSFHMINGVTLINPENIFIDYNTEILYDTVIESNVSIKDKTKIGKNCFISSGSSISNSIICDNIKVYSSFILDSIIKNNSRIGPFAYIRPNSVIGENVKVGDFVEIKNSNIDCNTKISHLTYIGDSDVGKNINFGCGTVTVNYDGKKKFRTTIKDNAFIGCNTNLIAPVIVGKNSYIAAGSTITNDIPDSAFAIARERQTNKLEYHKKK